MYLAILTLQRKKNLRQEKLKRIFENAILAGHSGSDTVVGCYVTAFALIPQEKDYA